MLLHLALLGLAALFLPIAAADWLPDPGTTPPALWLLALLAISIGPVFFMVSSQAPLMQAWFAKSDDPAASAPTFLYAASNAGSLAALLGPNARKAFVGLGSGTLACYERPGQSWTAFEIDPAVIGIARDRKLFRYIDKCKPDMAIIVGDARLMLSKTRPGSFDVLAVDAFSSDAIPLHLMTQEAFAVYGRTLAPDGVLMVHITNRFLDLEPVVAAIAKAEGWSARARRFKPQGAQPAGTFDAKSNWIILARSPERLDAVIAATGSAPGDWVRLRERPGMAPWSDDFASILPVLGSKFS